MIKVSEKSFLYYILVSMFIVPLAELLTELFGVPYQSQPLVIEYLGVIGLVLVILFYVQNRKEYLYKKTDVSYVLLIVFMLLSLIFSEDINHSLEERFHNEFPIHFICYYSLFFAGTLINSYKNKIKVLLSYLLVSVIHGIVGIFQSFGYRICDSLFYSQEHAQGNLVYGLTQHQNLYSGLSSLFIAACFGIFIFYDSIIYSLFKETSKKLYNIGQFIVLLVLGISFYTSICTSARMAWLANLVIILFYLISLLIAKSKKAINNWKSVFFRFLFATFFVAVIFIYILLTRDFIASEMDKTESELSSDKRRWGSSRVYLWLSGLSVVPTHPLTGIGLENYRWCFYHNPDPNWLASYGGYTSDKAHNEYIHLLVTQGIPALVNYLYLLFFAVSSAIKKVLSNEKLVERIITWTALSMFTVYAFQALANNSVINVAMYFWIVIGLLLPRNEQKTINWKKSK